jgi:hypothetical protein
MFCERTKEGATLATAGEFQEETKNRGSHHEDSTKGTNFHGDKTNKNVALP